MMPNFYDDLLQSVVPAAEVADDLVLLASAFAQTGNVTVAKRLYGAAETLRKVGTNVRRIAGEKVEADVKRAEEASQNVVRAALAGANLAARQGSCPG